MAESKDDNLEKSLSENQNLKMTKEQEIGFHTGAISTLANERNELLRMVQTVEVIMQSHLKRLDELGVKLGKK